MLAVYLVVGIVLLVAALVIRDQTQFRLARLRTELLALRSEEQRVAELRKLVENMVAQIGEALDRAERREREVAKSMKELAIFLEELGGAVDWEEDEARDCTSA